MKLKPVKASMRAAGKKLAAMVSRTPATRQDALDAVAKVLKGSPHPDYMLVAVEQVAVENGGGFGLDPAKPDGLFKSMMIVLYDNRYRVMIIDRAAKLYAADRSRAN